MIRVGTQIAVLGIGAALTLTMSAVFAQQETIDRCKQTSSKDDRIACLEAALLMRGGAAAQADDAPGPSIIAEAVATKPPAAAPVTSAEAPVSEQVLNPTRKTTKKTTGIGAEQVIARQQSQAERLAGLDNVVGLKVLDYKSFAHDRLQVTLENGQVWRQIRGDTQKVNPTLKKNQTVDISESSLGGYKLRLNEMQRTIRVQRIR